MMNQTTYEKLPDGEWTVEVTQGEDNSPLAQACRRKAEANKPHVVMGASVNGEIKIVQVLPELKGGG